MRHVTPETISAAFASYIAADADPRAREVFSSLARHLHAFAREVRLTHGEWRAGLEGLTRAGAISTAERNEFILLSDLLGVSALVDMLNTPPGATACSNLGPFHLRGAAEIPNGGDLWKGQPGLPTVVMGRVVDGFSGAPVAGAVLDLWQNAENGEYSNTDPSQPPGNYHAVLRCATDGSFAFTTTRPRPYTVPYDGPGGDMLRALGRDAWRPAHLHIIAEAPGYAPLVTELFLADEDYLERDAVFGVREELVVDFRPGTNKSALPAHLLARDQLPEGFLQAEVTIKLAPAKG
jgi:protocatechuate 3,4-dioxygenase beta subunit